MAIPYKAGDKAVHLVPATLGGVPVPDIQIMGASENIMVFCRRVNEMAGLAKAMRSCTDPTAFTAMLTRVNNIDD